MPPGKRRGSAKAKRHVSNPSQSSNQAHPIGPPTHSKSSSAASDHSHSRDHSHDHDDHSDHDHDDSPTSSSSDTSPLITTATPLPAPVPLTIHSPAKHHPLMRTSHRDTHRIGHSKAGSSTSLSSEPVIRVKQPSPQPSPAKTPIPSQPVLLPDRVGASAGTGANATNGNGNGLSVPSAGDDSDADTMTASSSVTVTANSTPVANPPLALPTILTGPVTPLDDEPEPQAGAATSEREPALGFGSVPSSPHNPNFLNPTSPLLSSLRQFGTIPSSARTPLNPDGTPGTPRRMQQAYLAHPNAAEEYIPSEPEFDSRPSTPHIPYAAHQPPPPYYEHATGSATPSFVATPRGTKPLKAPTLFSRVRLTVLQSIANAISCFFLAIIVLWALADRIYRRYTGQLDDEEYEREWDDQKRWENEALSKDPGYYARQCGFDIEDQTVETADGYLLRVHRVIVPGRSEEENRKGYPVLIQHGLFQTSGSFVTSEERSLAFWLAKHGGYQVYLGNNRGVFGMGHRSISRRDPRFWDYNIRELALYDIPALVDHVRLETGFDKIAFIGHSQGNATMFCSLAQGMVPSLSTKLSLFIALAPAVFAGPLTSGFPFWAIKSVHWHTWRRLFGVLDFIPLMRWSYDWVPGELFGRLGYVMFSFLFNWTDKNWLKRRKPKMFRFTPSPVPSAGIFWWTGFGGFSTRGCVLDPAVYKWYDQRFPPLSLYHGGQDLMVLLDPLLARLKDRETDVKVIRVHEMPDGEHCDTFWHVDAVELCFGAIMEDIESTKSSSGPRFVGGKATNGSTALSLSRSNSSTGSVKARNGTAKRADEERQALGINV